MGDQVFQECEGLVYKGDKLWVIAQIGFQLCVFRFDLNKYLFPGSSGVFDHFSPLNLNEWTDTDLDARGIKHITESVDHYRDVLQVIQWELDNPAHYPHIHAMLLWISQNEV
jgi:hypothetical protein